MYSIKDWTKENNVRDGFFEHDEFLAVRENLPIHLKPVVSFGYKSGWRLDAILSLPWNQIDRNNGYAWLKPGDTKNEQPWTIYFDSELKVVFDERIQSSPSSTVPPFNEIGLLGKVDDLVAIYK